MPESIPTVSKEVCNEIHKRTDGDITQNTADIKDLTKRTELLEQINIKLGEITSQHNKNILDLQQRVVVIESKPAKRYEYIVQNVIQWIVIALLAMSNIFTK